MPQPPTVRRAGPREKAEIDALQARSYPALLKPDYPPSVLVTALPLISHAQPALVAGGTYFVLEEEGVILEAGGRTAARPSRGAAAMSARSSPIIAVPARALAAR